MHYAFQDKEKLYLILNYFDGGDLRHHLSHHRRYSEEKIKFVASNIILGLEYLHNKNILHRDIKPENVILDSKGYLYLTDLGVARVWSPKNDRDTSGTPGYMAPEVLLRKVHGIGADMFALGVICYEMLLGKVDL